MSVYMCVIFLHIAIYAFKCVTCCGRGGGCWGSIVPGWELAGLTCLLHNIVCILCMCSYCYLFSCIANRDMMLYCGTVENLFLWRRLLQVIVVVVVPHVVCSFCAGCTIFRLKFWIFYNARWYVGLCTHFLCIRVCAVWGVGSRRDRRDGCTMGNLHAAYYYNMQTIRATVCAACSTYI